MGVSGCGKSAVGAGLAACLGLPFVEGDTPVNVARMAAGIPLDDADRWPWLDAAAQTLARGGIVSCSALKWSYHDRLRHGAGRPVTFVFLKGSEALLAERMEARTGHFMPPSLLAMPPSLLAGQLATLEDPSGEPRTVTVDINQPLAPSSLKRPPRCVP